MPSSAVAGQLGSRAGWAAGRPGGWTLPDRQRCRAAQGVPPTVVGGKVLAPNEMALCDLTADSGDEEGGSSRATWRVEKKPVVELA